MDLRSVKHLSFWILLAVGIGQESGGVRAQSADPPPPPSIPIQLLDDPVRPPEAPIASPGGSEDPVEPESGGVDLVATLPPDLLGSPTQSAQAAPDETEPAEARDPDPGQDQSTTPTAVQTARGLEMLEDSDEPVVQGIRVQPFSDSLRVVILLSNPAAYVLHEEERNDRVQLNLIKTRVLTFRDALNRLDDPRVEGIWLQQSTAESAVLEFRLGGDDVVVSDFANSQPPAIVLDFFGSNPDLVTIPGRGISQAHPDGFQARASAIPDNLNPDENEPVSSDGSGDGEEVDESTRADKKPGAEEHEITFTPQSDQYDGFPIQEIVFQEKRPQAMLDLFLQGQWATAFDEGIDYIEEHPDSPDLEPLLYLMAETRYQIGSSQNYRHLDDKINFFDQALELNDDGPLATFARRRLGHLYKQSGRMFEAIYHLKIALPNLTRRTRIQAWLELVDALIEVGQHEEALEMIRRAKTITSNVKDRIDLLALEGRLLDELGDVPGAWRVFMVANNDARLLSNPYWWREKVAWAHRYARLAEKMALQSPKPERAKEFHEIALEAYSYAVYRAEKRYTLDRPGMYLEYADLLRRKAEDTEDNVEARQLLDEADWLFLNIIKLADEGEEDAEAVKIAKKRLKESHGVELAEGMANYALMQLYEGRPTEAMRYLYRGYEQSVQSGASLDNLAPAIRRVLLPYMEEAAKDRYWQRVIGVWTIFGAQMREGVERKACMRELAKALSAIGLENEALGLIEQLIKTSDQTGTAMHRQLLVNRAAILNRMDRGEEVLDELEDLARVQGLTNLRVEALRVLAEVYFKVGRNLESAMAYQTLARIADLTPNEKGEAWFRAGTIYFNQGMYHQTREIGLTALIDENDQKESNYRGSVWDPEVGNKLRLMLARAYYMLGKQEGNTKAALTLKNFLKRDGIKPDERGLAYFLLGESHRRLRDYPKAREVFETAQADADVPSIWRKACQDGILDLDAIDRGNTIQAQLR